MTLLLLLTTRAWAFEYDGAATTQVQGREDALGTPFVGATEGLWGYARQPLWTAEGYGWLGFTSGVDQPFGGDLYLLSVDGNTTTVDWSVGRQHLDLPALPWLLDGARVAWAPNPHWRVEGWAGMAEHVALDTWTDGAPILRVAGTYKTPKLSGTLGLWGELGDSPAVHPDLEFRYRDLAAKHGWSTAVLVGAVAGADGSLGVENAHAELAFRPVAGTRALAWAEHREVVNTDSSLAAQILSTLAPDGYDEAGLGFGWYDVKMSQVYGTGSIASYALDPADPAYREVGLSGSLSWRPHCAAHDWCLSPAWRGAYGPGGAYHDVSATLTFPTPDLLTLQAVGMVLPYHTAHEAWDTALVGGLSFGIAPAKSWWSLTGGAELARDTFHDLDPRGWLAFRVGTP